MSSSRKPRNSEPIEDRIEELIEAARRVSTGTLVADSKRLLVRQDDMRRLWEALDNLD